MNALWRLLFRGDRVLSWLRYQATRRFSPAGMVMLVALLLTGLAGLDMNSTVCYQAFTVVVSLLCGAFCFGWFFRARFSIERRLPRFGTAGQPFDYPVVVTNLSGRPQDGLVLIEDLVDMRPPFPEWKAMQIAEQKTARSLRVSRGRVSIPAKPATLKEGTVPGMRANGTAEVRIAVTPLRRGVLRYRGVTVARPDPLGLFRALSSLALPGATLILPKRYPLPPIALPGVMKYQEGGVALASSVGQSEEFVALRDYRRGDPVRHIHWRSWAKTARPIVKEFADEFFVRHALVLDTFDENPRCEVFEEAVSVAASFASTIQTQESLLDLLFVGAEAYCFTAGRGLAHADQMLEILASVRVCTEKPFATLDDLVINHAGTLSGCICVLLAWDEPRQAFVKKLRAMGLPLLVVVLVSVAPAKPLDPGPMRDEADRFHVLALGQIEQGLAKL